MKSLLFLAQSFVYMVKHSFYRSRKLASFQLLMIIFTQSLLGELIALLSVSVPFHVMYPPCGLLLKIVSNLLDVAWNKGCKLCHTLYWELYWRCHCQLYCKYHDFYSNRQCAVKSMSLSTQNVDSAIVSNSQTSMTCCIQEHISHIYHIYFLIIWNTKMVYKG